MVIQTNISLGRISGGCPIDIPECLDEGNFITDNFGGCSSALSFENQGGCNYEFAMGTSTMKFVPKPVTIALTTVNMLMGIM